MYLLLKINFYDPNLEKCYTKAKPRRHSENNNENMANNSCISSAPENPEVLFPTDEVGNEVFNNNFLVLPHFVPMDAFQHVQNSGESINEYANADVVVASNDKGLRMPRFVYDLQVYKGLQQKLGLCESLLLDRVQERS